MTSTLISEADFEHWTKHGYVVVRLLDDDKVKEVLDNVYDYFPSWEEYTKRRHRYDALIASATGTLGPRAAFPFVGSALNSVATHPELLSFARRVMGVDRIMISHSILIAKYAGTRDFEQNLHCDYGNNTLVYPKPDTAIVDVPSITYYTDVTVDLGPTHLVPQEFTRGLLLEPRFRTRDDYPEIYQHELALTVPAGSTVIYSMNTFHRGSAMRATEGMRLSHHTSYKASGLTWCGQVTFQHQGGSPEMDHFLETATPADRELVGFPPVGDPYWDEVTVAGVAARYPKMDIEPYRVS
ncbi:MAG TPA: phytanoyl-CoA dioxygenase family protein [Acidimicrobiales bacterium]|nr:phytanoyl-CoA dioxygenase family protein [Acidimicrobiales bacterium]